MSMPAVPQQPQQTHDAGAIMEIMDEIISIYSDSTSDYKDITETYRIRSQLEEIYSNRQGDAKSIIKGLTTRVQDQEQSAADDQTKEHLQRMAELRQEKENVMASVKLLEESKQACLSSTEQFNKTCDGLGKLMDESDASRVADLPRIKHALSLYANITNIKWSYDSPKIAGQVLDSEAEEVRQFELDPSRHGDFYVANHLWDLIDPPIRD